MAKKGKATQRPESAILAAVEGATLRDLRLLSSLTMSTVHEHGGKLPGKLRQDIKVHSGKHAESRNASFVITFALVGDYEDGVTGIRIEATFGIIFGLAALDGVDDSGINLIGQSIGVHIAWPYWREFVQSSTARMLLPPLHIQLMRPGDMDFQHDGGEAKPTTPTRKKKGK